MSQLVTSPVVAAFATPFITALLAALGVWWKERSDRRDRANARQRMLTEVREEVNLIEAWVKAYDLVAPPEARSEVRLKIQNYLELAYARFDELLTASRNVEAPAQTSVREYLGVEKRAHVGGYLKAFLLIGRLQARVAKYVRVLYYASLLWGLIVLPAGLDATFNGGPGYTDTTYKVIGFVLTSLVTFLPPISFYILAIRTDRRARAVVVHDAGLSS